MICAFPAMLLRGQSGFSTAILEHSFNACALERRREMLLPALPQLSDPLQRQLGVRSALQFCRPTPLRKPAELVEHLLKRAESAREARRDRRTRGNLCSKASSQKQLLCRGDGDIYGRQTYSDNDARLCDAPTINNKM